MTLAENPWVKKAEKGYYSIIKEFANTIKRLPITEEHVRGNVLIAGQGSAFPERLLVCTPPNFNTTKKSVNSITFCDHGIGTNPKNCLKKEVSIKWRGEKPNLRGVEYYSDFLQLILPFIEDNTFDTVMMFRISYIQENLVDEGLLESIKRVLKPGGIFIGSGGFEALDIADEIMRQDFNILATKELPNPDSSGYVYWKTHIGFILQALK